MSKPTKATFTPISPGDIVIDSHGYLLAKCPGCEYIYRHDDDHAEAQQQLNALRVFCYAIKQALKVLEDRLPTAISWTDAMDAIRIMEDNYE